MKEEIESLLAICEVSLADNRAEKEDLLQRIVYINSVLPVVFANNRNVGSALKNFNKIIFSYMEESEAEYLFFEKAIGYLSSFLSNPDSIDEDVLSDIDDAIGYIEDLFTTRTVSTAQVVGHYESIIGNGILTDKNFYIANLSDRFDEEEKKRLLACVPEL